MLYYNAPHLRDEDFMKYNWRSLGIGLCLCLIPRLAVAAPQVVVSIKPLHSLVSMVTEGVTEPTLLIAGAGTPHHYALKPSEARKLASADLIVWVGPSLEAFMARPLNRLAGQATLLELQSSPSMQTLAIRGHSFARPRAGRSAYGSDPHLWLDPENAVHIVQTVSDQLIELDPAHAERYAANRDTTIGRIQALKKQLALELDPLQAEPFIVFHDAYQYFERAFGLQYVGALALSPERQPSVRQVRLLIETIKNRSVECVFSEPQFPSDLVQMISRETGVRVVSLDPLGASLPSGKALYFELMNDMAAAFSNCLSSESDR